MLTRRFQSFLCILALLGTVHAVDCTARAWVRAPDLIPDTIVQGDARVKISAGCPAVDMVLLGLRLKERSFIKTSRHDSQKDKTGIALQCAEFLGETDPWLIREEERLVFETTWTIDVAEGSSEDRDVVQDFAVLVPYTNFPPALDYANHVVRSGGGMLNSEFQYEYFIRVPFANGTTVEISAGITSFQPLFDAKNTPREPSLEIVGLERLRFDKHGKDSVTYAAEISSVSGLSFSEGSNDQVVDVVITRTGPARTFTEPLRVRGCVEPSVSSKWAVDYDMTSLKSMHSSVLRSTLEDFGDSKRNMMKRSSSCFGHTGSVSFTMPNATAEEIESRSVVTTRSAPVTLPIEVNRRHVSNFDLYYQTFANSFEVRLVTPRTECETVDSDNPSVEDPSTLHRLGFTDDEEPWVPWEQMPRPTFGMPRPKTWGTYIGKVPVVVHPVGQVTPSRGCIPPGTSVSHQVTLQGEHGCQQRSLLHYLDEGARGPAFVDPSAVHELLAKDPIEREHLAPLLAPVVSSPPKGEELGHRYHLRPTSRRPLIYVGETWVKKVVKKREHDVSFVH